MTNTQQPQALAATPCERCGSADIFIEREDLSAYQARCNDCGSRGPIVEEARYYDDEEAGKRDAIAAWNRRATPVGLAATPLSDIHGPLAGVVADFAPTSASFAIPEGLHPNTATLVRDFAEAMVKKLRASEIKRGWTANWMRKGWRDELAAELLRHVRKGDPIDVAAYCAFAWFHGWNVTPPEASATSGGQDANALAARLLSHADNPPDPEVDVEELARMLQTEQGRADAYRMMQRAYQDRVDAAYLLRAQKLHIDRMSAPVYDPLRRVDYPEGRFGPAMLDGDDEMSGKELKLIAKSHGFDLRLKVEEWDDEAAEIAMGIDSTFAASLEAHCPPQVDKDGYQLVGAWDSEDGDLVLAYVRPLTTAAKPEGSVND